MRHVNSTTCVPLPVNVTEISAEIGNGSEPLKQSVELSLVLIKLEKTAYELPGRAENNGIGTNSPCEI